MEDTIEGSEFDPMQALSYVSMVMRVVANDLKSVAVSPEMANAYGGFSNHYENYENATNDLELSTSISGIAAHASTFLKNALKSPDTVGRNESIIRQAIEHAGKLADFARSMPINLAESIQSEPSPSAEETRRSELDRKNTELEQRLTTVSGSATQLEERVAALTNEVKAELERAREEYGRGKARVDEETRNYADLLSHRAGEAINSDCADSARKELQSANSMRRVSLVFMVAAIAVLAITWLDHSAAVLTWEATTLRFLVALAFSVPAGYLARESARHRDQYHTYLRTALNLKSLAPYISSLPLEQQHLLKTEMAQRLFVINTQASAGDLGVINVHELLALLIKQLQELRK
ncbi:hypothetical protein RDV84_22135 [Lysobacter yananisis]|uniref:Uncharacterized protein n=1 Tax=Lysobacter yananisis TaxID=1003114 RepID=A0ABY9P6E4_9GAMM|nr:hypothetical protein [Lysobacter yananisis]WMT02632.1 hypothetical protein RDV84_22135 [Lysobacter yananisis]